MDIKEIFKEKIGTEVKFSGWIKNHRKQSDFGFIDLNDGTTQKNIQLVYTDKLNNFEVVSHLRLGSALNVSGKIIESPAKGQDIEVEVISIEVEGDCDEDYPLQSKGRPTKEFLRDIAYLRPRTNLFRAIFKIRSITAQAIHSYFQSHNYVYVNTPLITTTDCEGENQMFKITTLDLNDLPKNDGKVDMSKDLFGKLSFITGTGQLHGEAFASAYKKIYTFGPTFRTEKSNTKIHANEFWMIEPEIAFTNLSGLMDIEEEMLKSIVGYVLENASEEIDFCDKFVEKGLKEKLNNILTSDFKRITHKEVVDILLASKNKWEFTPDYESDIAKEHEKYITEYFNGPVFITDWPKDIKAWYMKINPDNKTVAAVDLVVPSAGELIGGSEREANYNKLINRMKEMNIDESNIEWYLNLRRFGSCTHSGFGMGFERLVIYLTGIENIRDAIPFPRTPNSCDF